MSRMILRINEPALTKLSSHSYDRCVGGQGLVVVGALGCGCTAKDDERVVEVHDVVAL